MSIIINSTTSSYGKFAERAIKMTGIEIVHNVYIKSIILYNNIKIL